MVPSRLSIRSINSTDLITSFPHKHHSCLHIYYFQFCLTDNSSYWCSLQHQSHTQPILFRICLSLPSIFFPTTTSIIPLWLYTQLLLSSTPFSVPTVPLYCWYRPSSNTRTHFTLSLAFSLISKSYSFSWLLSLLRHWCNTENSLHSESHLPSIYLFGWDSNAAPHLIFHALLWWSHSSTTRLAEHLSAELHRYQSDSASPKQADLCRSPGVYAPLCLHVCVPQWVSTLLCLASGLPVAYIVQSVLHKIQPN